MPKKGPLVYPKGRLAMGAGDLLDIVDFSLDIKDNASAFHTIGGWGVVQGNEEVDITFNVGISEEGPEADWDQLVQKMIIKELRFKFPGLTIGVKGKFTNVKYGGGSDKPVTADLTFIGQKTA